MEVKKNSISIILPNYNGKELMEMYIPFTIEALKHSGVDFEFIVIDDCSTDDSVAFINAQYPDFMLLTNPTNQGFSYTCNRGITTATKELILLLNTDVKLTPTYFQHQFRYFEDPDAFGVMGCIMNFDDKKIEDAARFPSYKIAKFKANTFYYLEDQGNEWVKTAYLSGANALVSRKKINLLNGFNEIYSPFYFEDFDLGLRAWKMGWNLYYDHQSVCHHHVSSSTNKLNKSNFVQITYNRNSFILQAIHLNGIRRMIWFVQLYTVILFGHLLKGDFWILKSLKLFIKKSHEIKVARRKIKELQTKLNVDYQLAYIIRSIKRSLVGKQINWLK